MKFLKKWEFWFGLTMSWFDGLMLGSLLTHDISALYSFCLILSALVFVASIIFISEGLVYE